jgi:hypothetical protein
VLKHALQHIAEARKQNILKAFACFRVTLGSLSARFQGTTAKPRSWQPQHPASATRSSSSNGDELSNTSHTSVVARIDVDVNNACETEEFSVLTRLFFDTRHRDT